MNPAFIRVPERARSGAVIPVKVLIRHPMETGHRRDRVGAPIPRDIIHSFRASFDDEEVFRMDLFPGIAANPYLEFNVVVTRTGTLTCRWEDDAGGRHEQSATVTVE